MATLQALIDGLQCPRCGNSNTYVVRDIERTERVGKFTRLVRMGEAYRQPKLECKPNSGL